MRVKFDLRKAEDTKGPLGVAVVCQSSTEGRTIGRGVEVGRGFEKL